MLTNFVIPVSHALVHVLCLLSLTRLMFGEFGPPTASSFGHWCTAGVLPRTTSAPYSVQDDSAAERQPCACGWSCLSDCKLCVCVRCHLVSTCALVLSFSSVTVNLKGYDNRNKSYQKKKNSNLNLRKIVKQRFSPMCGSRAVSKPPDVTRTTSSGHGWYVDETSAQASKDEM